MKEFVKSSFEEAALPAGWVELERRCSWERGALRSNGGAVLLAHITAPRYYKIRIVFDVEPIRGAHLTWSDGTLAVIIDLTNGRQLITYSGKCVLAESRVPMPSNRQRFQVVIDINHGQLGITLDGKECLTAKDPARTPFLGRLEFGIWDDCLLHSISVSGADEELSEANLAASSAELVKPFHFEMTVDFFDDLIRAPWTKSMFHELFRLFKSWGVSRCHWIYYGKKADGYWQHAEGVEENARITLENVGEILPIAVEVAHAYGIEIYAIIKPFDFGYSLSYSRASERVTDGKLERIGGPIGWIADFVAERRDLMMQRRPNAFGLAASKAITRIDIVKEDATSAAFSIGDVEIFVSDDNSSYRRYEGSITRAEIIEEYPIWVHTPSGGMKTNQTRRSLVFRFTDLEIREDYMLIFVPGRAKSLANSFINLIHVFNEDSEERMVTYGVETRVGAAELDTRILFVPIDPDFRRDGVEFDRYPGTPTAYFPGYEAISNRFILDEGEGFIAIAKGKEASPFCALSPSFSETRNWWLSLIQDCLESGVDGIELRGVNHNSPFTWDEFGFETPVREEFLRTYGVDIWATDDFDRALWRRMRGEHYTGFCRQVRHLTSQFGKRLGIHIGLTEDMEPEYGGAMGLHWDWRTWIDEGIVDSVTMKEVWPQTRLAEEILKHSRSRGVSVVFAPYANDLWQRPGGDKVCEYWISSASEHGFDGYQFYEGAAIIGASPDGEVSVLHPPVEDVFKRAFT